MGLRGGVAIVLIFVLYFLSTAIASTPDLFQAPLAEPSQVAVFERVNARLRQQQGVTAEFIQTKYLSVLTRPLLSSGRFIFSEQRGVLWNQKSPFIQTLVISKGGIAEYLEDGTLQSAPTAGQGAVTGFSTMFLSLFSGDVTELKEQFELFFVGTDESWQIGAKPRSEDVARFVDRIAVNGGSTPERVVVWERNGDRSEIEFKSIVVGAPVLDPREQQFFR